MNHIVHIGLPDPDEIAAMMRVRLGKDLPDADLRGLSELAIGATGADVEKIVSDARRIARQEKRAVAVADLRAAVAGPDDRSDEVRYRTCVHEASHIVMDVLHIRPRRHLRDLDQQRLPRWDLDEDEHGPTPGHLRRTLQESLQIMLAGRVGEEWS